MNILYRLTELRQCMKDAGIDAYIIPSSDPHISEYAADHWLSRVWISGFTGSAGTVIITQDHAGLWSDSRYFIQGPQELADTDYTFHKMIDQFKPYHIDWLKEHMKSGMTIGFDGQVQTQAFYEKMKATFSPVDVNIDADHDLIDKAWKDRPAIPRYEIYEHDTAFAGMSRTDRLVQVRAQMQDHDHYFISALDEIAWLFNLRGKDVESNPVGIMYAVVSKHSSHIFIFPEKVNKDLAAKLTEDGIVLQDYNNISQYLSAIPTDESIIIDKTSCNSALYNKVSTSHIVQQDSIVKHLKAIKNDTEIAHFKNAMVKDGVALTHAFYWLEQTLEHDTVSEYHFAMKLAEYRSKQEHYVGESFNAIVGYKANGAMQHYRPMLTTSKQIAKEGMLLCDSGGQYLDGTTDITRTIALSPPTAEQKLHYTLVLQGNIALDAAKFPKGTNGGQLDVLARNPLWSRGLNFGHGTGHGVGFFLNVHEGPQGFAPPSSERGRTVHKVGMVTTNEPGFYLDGEYGIRIENVLVTVEDTDGFLKHDTITLFPIDTTLIDMDIFTKQEVSWLNDYHDLVYEKLSPLLDATHEQWLKNKCAHISVQS